MRIAIIGRTRWLLNVAKLLLERGHKIGVVITSDAEEFYNCPVDEFEELANIHGIQFYHGASFLSYDIVSESMCDLGVSINWPYVIDSEIISAFREGILNAHAGDLPRFRGNACPNWAILLDEAKIALTIHKMDEGLDTGAILSKQYFELRENTYIGDIYDWLDRVIPQHFVQTIEGLVSKKIKPVPQSTSGMLPLRTYPRRPTDSKIDWGSSAQNIVRLVRASGKPFTGAYCFLEGKQKLTIWAASWRENDGSVVGVPGQIISRCKMSGDVEVLSGNGIVVIEGIEFESSGGGLLAPSSVLKSLRERLS